MDLSDHLATFVTGATSIGIALALIAADPRSPTTRAIAAAFVLNGIGQPAVVLAAFAISHSPQADSPWLAAILVFFSLAPFAALAEWLLGVARTAQTSARSLRWITVCSRIIQGVTTADIALTVLCAATGQFEPGSFLFTIPDAVIAPLIGIPLAAVLAALPVAGVLLSMQRLDAAERIRAFALGPAAMLFFISILLEKDTAAFCNLAGQLIFLVGAVRYQGMQGERGRLLSKFLSPEVDRLVREKGLDYLMQPQSLEITAVSCDLRGFTHFSQLHSSADVMRLLGDYYEATGAIAARLDATVASYAGDGILLFVGAPVPVSEHARKGLELAQGIRTATREVLQRWQRADAALGIGVGVATGMVSAGGIGSAGRTEYTAIGSTVNLASRLCSIAADGEILVDTRTAGLAGGASLTVRAPVPLKGFGDSVQHFAA